MKIINILISYHHAILDLNPKSSDKLNNNLIQKDKFINQKDFFNNIDVNKRSKKIAGDFKFHSFFEFIEKQEDFEINASFLISIS